MRTSSMSLATRDAVLAYTVQGHNHGFTVHSLGIILMIAGCAALILTSVLLWNRRRKALLRRQPDTQVFETSRISTVPIETVHAPAGAEPHGKSATSTTAPRTVPDSRPPL